VFVYIILYRADTIVPLKHSWQQLVVCACRIASRYTIHP